MHGYKATVRERKWEEGVPTPALPSRNLALPFRDNKT